MIRKTTKVLLGSAATLAISATAAMADVEVNLVHIEQHPETVAIMEDIARAYEAAHPDVTIKVQYIENEAFKSRLPTMLQSNDAPDIFYSWGGGVLAEQVRGGVLKDISSMMDDEWRSWLAPSAVNAFTINDGLYGVPVRTSLVNMFYNKALFEQAGVDADAIETYEDFLAAIKALKAAGITPITIGGQEGWPQHFYFSLMSMRAAGHENLQAALNGEASFTDPEFVLAFEKLKELAALEPFQEGWLAATTGQSYANFGNSKAAMLLQGDWAHGLQATQSANGEGLGDDLGTFTFPQVEGGVANSEETFGGLNAWIFFRDAPEEAVDFVRFYSQPENLKRLATEGTHVAPMVGMADALDDPWAKHIATTIEQSSYHQNFFNVMFTEEVNREILDIVTSVLTDDLTPEEAAAALQEAWDFSRPQ